MISYIYVSISCFLCYITITYHLFVHNINLIHSQTCQNYDYYRLIVVFRSQNDPEPVLQILMTLTLIMNFSTLLIGLSSMTVGNGSFLFNEIIDMMAVTSVSDRKCVELLMCSFLS